MLAEVAEPPNCCQKCGTVRQHNLSRYGHKEQCYMDIPIRGKRVGIYVDRQRYICRDCGATFFEDLTDMDNGHFVTKRLTEYIEKESLKRTFTSIADDVGVDEKTIRNIFREFYDALLGVYRPEIPNWIGIDEIKLVGSLRCLITDIQNRSVIDFLPMRT
ncbi:MAG TPA: helix-turn-helix domain-containing protein, partial [Flavobacterium sp.]|nr:helix-turn-helix domain-containing protein [Flavobacterium sp.]